MSTKSHTHVRQMEVGDFEFVRSLAAKQSSFTVPPPYVLWLLLRIRDAVCLIAEHRADGLLGYVLAVPVDAPSIALYVWQLAVNERGARQSATSALLRELYAISRRLRVRTIGFSAVPGSAHYRAIRRGVWRVSATEPMEISKIPRVVSKNEIEYCVRLKLK